jgi:hypothetical protein
VFILNEALCCFGEFELPNRIISKKMDEKMEIREIFQKEVSNQYQEIPFKEKLKKFFIRFLSTSFIFLFCSFFVIILGFILSISTSS